MRRKKKTSKFYKRSYSKPMFDPQRLLYFSTTNQRLGKVIRPKTYAIGSSPTQSVQDQNDVLENLNNTKMFRTVNQRGQNYYYSIFNDRVFTLSGILPYNNEFDKTYRISIDPTDFDPGSSSNLNLFKHSFYPFTPNQLNIIKGTYTITIGRPDQLGLNLVYNLKEVIRDRNNDTDSTPIDSAIIPSFHYLDTLFVDTIGSINLVIETYSYYNVDLSAETPALTFKVFPNDLTDQANMTYKSSDHSVTFNNNAISGIEIGNELEEFVLEQSNRCNPEEQSQFSFYFNGIGRNNTNVIVYYLHIQDNQQVEPNPTLPPVPVSVLIEYKTIEEYPQLTRT